MINYLKKLLARIQLWLYGHPCTYTCCDKDRRQATQSNDTRRAVKATLPEPAEKPEQGGFIY